jgi:hypothetical protein
MSLTIWLFRLLQEADKLLHAAETLIQGDNAAHAGEGAQATLRRDGEEAATLRKDGEEIVIRNQLEGNEVHQEGQQPASSRSSFLRRPSAESGVETDASGITMTMSHSVSPQMVRDPRVGGESTGESGQISDASDSYTDSYTVLPDGTVSDGSSLSTGDRVQDQQTGKPALPGKDAGSTNDDIVQKTPTDAVKRTSTNYNTESVQQTEKTPKRPQSATPGSISAAEQHERAHKALVESEASKPPLKIEDVLVDLAPKWALSS